MPKITDARRAERRTQILEAAWACFQRQGLHATTMDDIIREAGLSAGAVYSYFPGKEDLIFAAVTTSLAGIRELVAPLLATRPLPPPATLVCRIGQLVTDFTARETYDLRRVALLGWAETQRNERLRETMRGFYLGFRSQLEQAAEEWRAGGAVSADAVPQDVAKALLATILGFVVQSALLGDVRPDEVAAGLASLGGRTVTPRGEPPAR